MSGTRKAVFLTTALASGLVGNGAQAVSNNVTFTGTVTTSCTINVINGTGTLTTGSTLSSLSSKNPGGSPAKVSITTTGGVRVSLDTVSSVTAPSADTGPTVWAPVYSMSGPQTVAETNATTLMTAAGTTNMDIHLTGTKPATDSFRDGNYSATVTVRCE